MSTLRMNASDIITIAFDCHACPVGQCPHITVLLPEYRSRSNIDIANSLLQGPQSLIDTDDEEEEEEDDV